MNPVKRHVLFNAIRIDAGHFGETGRASYSGRAFWHWYPDDLGSPAQVSLSRAEIHIPKLDKTKTVRQPTKLDRMVSALQQKIEDPTYNKQPLWAIKPGVKATGHPITIEDLTNIRLDPVQKSIVKAGRSLNKPSPFRAKFEEMLDYCHKNQATFGKNPKPRKRQKTMPLKNWKNWDGNLVYPPV